MNETEEIESQFPDLDDRQKKRVGELFQKHYEKKIADEIARFFNEDFHVHKWYVEQTTAEYLKKRDAAETLQSNSANRFEKTILQFSVGAIALSLTFLQILESAPIYEWLLIGSWGVFGISILAMLYNSISVQRAMGSQIKIYDEQFRSARRTGVDKPVLEFDEREYRKLARQSNWAYWISGITFLIGIALFAAFTFLNMPRVTGEEHSSSFRDSNAQMEAQQA